MTVCWPSGSIKVFSTCRDKKWQEIWRTVAENVLLTQFATNLADQDIFNAVIKSHPDLLHRLPCQWNIQLSLHGLAEELCYGKLFTRVDQ